LPLLVMGIFETFGDGEGKPVQEKMKKTSGKQAARKTAPALFITIAKYTTAIALLQLHYLPAASFQWPILRIFWLR